MLLNNDSIAIVSTEPINVKAFGAKGNSVDDDKAALQSAFDYAKANKKPVYIPAGTYKYSGNLTIDSISVFGDRIYSVLMPTDATGGEILIKGNKTNLSDFSLEGSKATRTSGSGIKTDSNPTNVNIKNLNINNYPSKGIELNNIYSGGVENCTITNCTEQGIVVAFSHNLTFTHCEFSNCHDGIQIWGGDAAISTKTEASNITISNCIAYNPVLSTAYAAGFWAGLTDGITIENCVVENCDDVGIDLEACNNSTVTGNVVKNCKYGCLAVFYGGKGNVFSSNTVLQESGFGIDVVCGNGIYLHGGADKKIENCIFANNTVTVYNRSAFYADDTVLNKVPIKNNSFVQTENTTVSGVRLVDGDKVSFVGNSIEVFQAIGIAYEGMNDGNIKDNTIICKSSNSNNADIVGIQLYWRSNTYHCQNNTISSNTIRGFTKSIYDYVPDTNVTSNNWFHHNRVSSLHKSTNAAGYQGRYDNNVSLTNPNTVITVQVS